MKITRATLKSFARKNAESLFLEISSHFDGMVDCVMPVEPVKRKIENWEETLERYLVGGGRDYITAIDNGFHISNCCGTFTITNK